MKVLITGATGFLGSHLCRRMVDEGHVVRILARPTSDFKSIERLPVERVIGDVTDSEIVKRAVRNQEWVIHAAAYVDRGGENKSHLMKVNVEGTRHVAEACRLEGVHRLIHISSVGAVGIPTDRRQPADENFPFNVDESTLPYHLSKRQAEQEVTMEVAQGLNAVIVNPAFIFGPNGSQYRGMGMMEKVRRNRIVPYFTGGICTVHVQDVVEGVVAALGRGVTGNRYILGGDNLTYRSLVKETARAMNLRRQFIPVPPFVTGLAANILDPWGRLRNRQPRISYADHYYVSRYHFYDSSKAGKALGYAPRDFGAILDECLQLNID